MNFYIGNSIDEINIEDANIAFYDELFSFIYKLDKQIPFDMSKFYKIDPYDDVVISKNDLPTIINICNYILEFSLIQNYKERDEGKLMLQSLVEIAKEAMEKGKGLISIGD